MKRQNEVVVFIAIAIIICGILKPVISIAVTYKYDPIVEDIQKRLKDLGYHSGKIDGKLGNETKMSIKKFQRNKGLHVTGNINDELIQFLDINDLSRKTISSSKQPSHDDIWNFATSHKLLISCLFIFFTVSCYIGVKLQQSMKTFNTEKLVKGKGGNGIFTDPLPIKWCFIGIGFLAYIGVEHNDCAVIRRKCYRKSIWKFKCFFSDLPVRKVLLYPDPIKEKIYHASTNDNKVFQGTEVSASFKIIDPIAIVEQSSFIENLKKNIKSNFIAATKDSNAYSSDIVSSIGSYIQEKLNEEFNSEKKIVFFTTCSITDNMALDYDPERDKEKYILENQAKIDEHNRNIQTKKIEAATALGISSMNTNSSPDSNVLKYIKASANTGIPLTSTQSIESRYTYEYKKLQMLKEHGNIKDFRYEPDGNKGSYRVSVVIERESKEIVIESKKYPELAPEIEIDGQKKSIIKDWKSEMSIHTAIQLAKKYSDYN